MTETSGEKPRGRSLSDFHMLVYRVFHAQRAYLRPRIASLGLGPGQPKLLVYLAVHGQASGRELADFFETDPATVSRMLDALERGGFVTSCPGADRRTKAVSVTDRGRTAAASWDLCCDEEQDVLLEGFSADERRQFAEFLARGYANLRRAAAGEGARRE